MSFFTSLPSLAHRHCGFNGLNIIVPLAKIVKDFGTAKKFEEKYVNMAKCKK